MEGVKTIWFSSFLQELSNGSGANRTVCATIAKEASVKPGLQNLFSTLSILLLVTASQSGAQTPHRDNRPGTASIGGRVTIGGAPAANALVMVMEVDPQSRGESFGDESQQRAFVKVRTDSDGRYRVTGLTEGAYRICAISKAYV